MTDLDLKALLQQLAPVRSNGEPIVSLYVKTHFSDEQARERARVFVRDCARNELDRHAEHPQKEALKRTLDRVTGEAIARIEQSLSEAPKGLAIFACESQNLWRVVETAVTVECALHVNARCHLLQLARLLDDVEPAVVAVVHQRGARMYEVALGGIVNEATVEGPLPRSSMSGGNTPRPANGRQAMRNDSGNMMGEGFQYERAQKNQRHYEKSVERNRTAAADYLTQRFDQHPSHVVLVGPPEAVAAFERALPPRVQQRVIMRTRQPAPVADSRSGRDAIVMKALEAVEHEERKKEQVAVDAAVGEAMRGGMAVLGPEDVVLAVNERRVHRLILEADCFERTGWMCRNCGALGVDHVEKCSYCNGDLAWVEALGEEIAGRVIADDGDVEVIPHSNKLHSYKGIAAMLRQASARGLGIAPNNAPRS